MKLQAGLQPELQMYMMHTFPLSHCGTIATSREGGCFEYAMDMHRHARHLLHRHPHCTLADKPGSCQPGIDLFQVPQDAQLSAEDPCRSVWSPETCMSTTGMICTAVTQPMQVCGSGTSVDACTRWKPSGIRYARCFNRQQPLQAFATSHHLFL